MHVNSYSIAVYCTLDAVAMWMYLGNCALFQDNAPSNTIATGSKITVTKW